MSAWTIVCDVCDVCDVILSKGSECFPSFISPRPLTTVVLPTGQTRRGGEEEQGTEGGSLPVDEWTGGTRQEQERTHAQQEVELLLKKNKSE